MSFPSQEFWCSFATLRGREGGGNSLVREDSHVKKVKQTCYHFRVLIEVSQVLLLLIIIVASHMHSALPHVPE